MNKTSNGETLNGHDDLITAPNPAKRVKSEEKQLDLNGNHDISNDSTHLLTKNGLSKVTPGMSCDGYFGPRLLEWLNF